MTRLLLTSLLLLLILPLSACDDDDCTTCVGDPPAPEPTLANVWPNDDGREWTYDFLHRSWPDTTTAPDAIFTIDDVDSVLAVTPTTDARTEANIWRQAFEGMYTTGPGVQGQNLRGYYYEDVEGGVRRWVPVESSPRTERLALPRRVTIPELLARRICCVGGLLLEGGPAFVKTDELIGTYGELGPELSWKWLEANLEPGAGFTLQLVPAVADDVFLHSEIREVHDLSTPYADFENALSVNYLIDHGEVTLIGPGGVELGTFRPYTFGRMEFVPEVGPVYSIERAVFPLVEAVPELGTVEEYEYWMIGTKGADSP